MGPPLPGRDDDEFIWGCEEFQIRVDILAGWPSRHGFGVLSSKDIRTIPRRVTPEGLRREEKVEEACRTLETLARRSGAL